MSSSQKCEGGELYVCVSAFAYDVDDNDDFIRQRIWTKKKLFEVT